jgi:predicted acetyltransferase
MPLLLRPVREEDEQAMSAAHAAMKEDHFSFALGSEAARDFKGYLRDLDDRLHGRKARAPLASGRVAETFLVADVDGTIVGRLSLRHTLNELLRRIGGHIGFGVLREHRRRGYATEMLRQALPLARARGLTRVLLTCDDDNLGSRSVIERCGGVHTQTLPPDGELAALRHYWIEL